MRLLLLSLLLLPACSGGLGSYESSDLVEDGTLCGWVGRQERDLGATSVPGDCWYFAPPADISVMPAGSRACDAGDGARPRVWADGETVSVFARLGSSGSPHLEWAEVPCPAAP